ncbi:MAG: hypothetical protein ACQEP1_06740, partial [Nanobdellota archaeon]
MGFYPYNSEESGKKGYGSKLLEQMINDARDWGAKLLDVSTREDGMRNFLEKKDFNHYHSSRTLDDRTIDFYYKPLNF